jgi:tetratricopeptide (TPR) repeat protein
MLLTDLRRRYWSTPQLLLSAVLLTAGLSCQRGRDASAPASSTAKAQRVESLLNEAWDLMGGKSNTVWVSADGQLTARSRADLEHARRDIQEALNLDPRSDRAHELNAIYLARSGRPGDAEREIKALIQRSPKFAPGYNALGNIVLSQHGRLAEAITCFKKASEIDPDYALAFYNLGNALSAAGRPDEALAAYSQCLGKDGSFARCYNNRGTIYHKRRDFDRALADYRKATELDDGLAEAYENLGDLLMARERFGEAVKAYRHAIAIGPERAELGEKLAEARQRRGDLTLISISLLLLTLLTALISIGGATWDKVRHRITSRGWAAVGAFILIFVLAAYKEYRLDEKQQSDERKQLKLSDQLTTAVNSLSHISNAPASNGPEVANQALDRLFDLHRRAVVKVRADIGDEHREKSGFFFNSAGYVLTADFAAWEKSKNLQASKIVIETIDGLTVDAKLELLDENLAIAVLKSAVPSRSHIDLELRPPRNGEQILVIGSTPSELFIRSAGSVSAFHEFDGAYARERDSLPGFGGGPLIDGDGLAMGVNWGAFEPPRPGLARFTRADRIREYLISKGIPL